MEIGAHITSSYIYELFYNLFDYNLVRTNSATTPIFDHRRTIARSSQRTSVKTKKRTRHETISEGRTTFNTFDTYALILNMNMPCYH